MNSKSSPTQNPLAELRHFLTCFAARCREANWLRPLAHVRVTTNIVGEIVTWFRELGQRSYSAEQCSREALARMKAAQDPSSDGGEAITKKEAASFSPLIVRSAEHNHRISSELVSL